jgi:hypothetical protein
MPSNPNVVYRKTKEWISWSDFLNAKPYRHFKAIDYRGFNDSRSFVRSLNLSSFRDYARWSKTSNRPSDIPSDPYKVYRKTDEWISWDDYLGISHKFRSFHFARVYIRSLGLQTCDCYRLWAKSEDRPYDIPAAPYSYYRKTGEWISWPDFLGNKS